jgi:hypothetical protein
MCKALADTLQNDTVFSRLVLADTLMGDDGPSLKIPNKV